MNGHRISGTPAQLGMFYKVINALSCRYKFALTATPYRNIKGTEKALFSLIGDIICEITNEQIADKIVKAEIHLIKTNFSIPNNALKYDGTINYSVLTTVLCEDEERNHLILDILKRNKNKCVLILSDRLSQLEYLRDKLGYGVKIDGSMTSKKKKKLREQYIQDVRNGKENLIMASFRISKRRARYTSIRHFDFSESS